MKRFFKNIAIKTTNTYVNFINFFKVSNLNVKASMALIGLG